MHNTLFDYGNVRIIEEGFGEYDSLEIEIHNAMRIIEEDMRVTVFFDDEYFIFPFEKIKYFDVLKSFEAGKIVETIFEAVYDREFFDEFKKINAHFF